MLCPNYKRAQVQGPKEFLLTIRRTRAFSPLGRLGQVSSYSPHRLVSRNATLQKRSLQVCRRARYRILSPLDDPVETSKAYIYIESEEMTFAGFFFKQDHHRRLDNRFLRSHFRKRYFTKCGQSLRVWSKELSIFSRCDLVSIVLE